jgi:hypothetical protein
MKKLTFILILLFSNYIQSQHHFKIENNSVIWQHTFETDSVESLQNILTSTEFTNNLILENDSGFVIRNKEKLDLKYLLNSKGGFTAYLFIDIEKYQYTVTIKNILFKGFWDQMLLDSKPYKYYVPESTLEKIVLKNKDFTFRKNKVTQKNLNGLSQFFLRAFSRDNK